MGRGPVLTEHPTDLPDSRSLEDFRGLSCFARKVHMASQSAAQPSGSAKPGQKAPDFLVHEDGDSVGVIVIEGVEAHTELTGWIMREDRTVAVKVLDDIPIGHKVALKDLAVGEGVVKYGVDIGKIVAAVKKGEHVHVHNLKTRRW
jgi:(2R)-sulfolactate sulfo-lyase subunit alpha